MLEKLLVVLLVCSWLFWLVALYLVHDFFRQPRPQPDCSFAPPVSILKPVKGLDVEAYENFASFCRQDYPDFELLFGVADPDDPVIPVIERLKRDFPQVPIRLYLIEPFGANRKASLLHGLAGQASHELLVVSDSDMRVTPDYLRRVVAPMAEAGTGLVTCPYQGDLALTFTARLEALHMGATFLPSVLVARAFLNMRFAMGATNVLRRSDLARIGGFAALADYLADDYQLGVHIASLGLRVQLSDYIVASILGATTFREQWDREVRWARCNRVSRAREYPGLLLTFSTPLAAVLLVVSGFTPLAWRALAFSLCLRWIVAWFVTGYTRDLETRRWLVWLPIRDMLSALVWLAGSFGRRVVWRGEEFILVDGGRMQPVSAEMVDSELRPLRFTAWPGDRLNDLATNCIRALVRGLDRLLRRLYGIYEFCDQPGCIFRLRLARLKRDLPLPDGLVRARDPVVEIHLWNEQVLPIPAEGPDFAWARQMQRMLLDSLQAMAGQIQSDPRLRDARAVGGATVMLTPGNPSGGERLMRRLGFVVLPYHNPLGRFGEFWENFYTWLLMWTFNVASLQQRRLFRLRRSEVWMSVDEFLRRYGSGRSAKAP